MKVNFFLRRALCIQRNAGYIGLIKVGGTYIRNSIHLRYLDIIWFLYKLRKKESPVITTRHGNLMQMRRNDEGISKEITIYRIHEPNHTELIHNTVKDGQIIIDIGANIGYYALLEAKLVGTSGLVIAIEPLLENVESLRKNVMLNDLTNVSIIHGAVTDTDGKSNLYLSRSSNLPSLFKTSNWDSSMGIQEVRAWKLDTLIDELKIAGPVSIIRMDIEGGEVDATAGMVQTLQKYKPKLFIEMHPAIVGKNNIIEMLERFKEFGYEIKQIIYRDKDFPWSKTNGNRITMSIDDLIKDKYTLGAERFFTVFLA